MFFFLRFSQKKSSSPRWYKELNWILLYRLTMYINYIFWWFKKNIPSHQDDTRNWIVLLIKIWMEFELEMDQPVRIGIGWRTKKVTKTKKKRSNPRVSGNGPSTPDSLQWKSRRRSKLPSKPTNVRYKLRKNSTFLMLTFSFFGEFQWMIWRQPNRKCHQL